MKAIAGLDYGVSGTGYVGVGFYTGGTLTDAQNIVFDMSDSTDALSLIASAETAISAYAVSHSYSLTEGIFWTYPVNPAYNPTESSLSLSLVTGTGAVGTQISSTKGAWVTVTGSISTTATIGGASSGDIIVEVAPTNSATAGDWVEKGRIGNSQTITLAIALNSVQVTKGQVTTYVPAGYYLKARSVGSGTFTNTLLEARQIV